MWSLSLHCEMLIKLREETFLSDSDSSTEGAVVTSCYQGVKQKCQAKDNHSKTVYLAFSDFVRKNLYL